MQDSWGARWFYFLTQHRGRESDQWDADITLTKKMYPNSPFVPCLILLSEVGFFPSHPAACFTARQHGIWLCKFLWWKQWMDSFKQTWPFDPWVLGIHSDFFILLFCLLVVSFEDGIRRYWCMGGQFFWEALVCLSNLMNIHISSQSYLMAFLHESPISHCCISLPTLIVLSNMSRTSKPGWEFITPSDTLRRHFHHTGIIRAIIWDTKLQLETQPVNTIMKLMCNSNFFLGIKHSWMNKSWALLMNQSLNCVFFILIHHPKIFGLFVESIHLFGVISVRMTLIGRWTDISYRPFNDYLTHLLSIMSNKAFILITVPGRADVTASVENDSRTTLIVSQETWLHNICINSFIFIESHSAWKKNQQKGIINCR